MRALRIRTAQDRLRRSADSRGPHGERPPSLRILLVTDVDQRIGITQEGLLHESLLNGFLHCFGRSIPQMPLERGEFPVDDALEVPLAALGVAPVPKAHYEPRRFQQAQARLSEQRVLRSHCRQLRELLRCPWFMRRELKDQEQLGASGSPQATARSGSHPLPPASRTVRGGFLMSSAGSVSTTFMVSALTVTMRASRSMM